MGYSPSKLLARLGLLFLLLGTVAAFSSPLTHRLNHAKKRHHSVLLSKQNDCDDLYLSKTAVHSFVLGAAIVASAAVSTELAQAADLIQPYLTVHDAVSSNQISDISTIPSIQTVVAASTTPMGELPEESGINPMFSTFGQWFFLIYVVVSLLAGGKEIFGRIAKQFDKDN